MSRLFKMLGMTLLGKITVIHRQYPHFVSNVEQVEGAGQLHLRLVSRALSFKLFVLGAEHCDLSLVTDWVG